MEKIMAFISILLVAVVFYFVGAMPLKQEIKRMNERQAEMNKVNLRKQGGTSLYSPPGWNEKYFNYDLRSWNAGKDWYAVEYDKDLDCGRWGLKILGDANELYPGLLEHLKAWDDLTCHVANNGPVDGSDSSGISLLKKIGFTASNN